MECGVKNSQIEYETKFSNILQFIKLTDLLNPLILGLLVLRKHKIFILFPSLIILLLILISILSLVYLSNLFVLFTNLFNFTIIVIIIIPSSLQFPSSFNFFGLLSKKVLGSVGVQCLWTIDLGLTLELIPGLQDHCSFFFLLWSHSFEVVVS